MARWRQAWTAGIGFLMAGAAPTAEPSGTGLMSAILACHEITEPDRRLGCYDVAVARLGSAAAKSDVVVIDRAPAQREREAGFGLPRHDKPARIEQALRVETVERKTYDGKIVSVSPAYGYELFIIKLADGSAWRTIEAGDQPPAGALIHISKGLIGNYLAAIKGHRALRVERIR